MNISRLGQPSGFGSSTPRTGKTDTRPTATAKRDPTVPVDGSGETSQGGSARIASFEDSLQSRIDQMAASGKFSPRQMAVLEDTKKQLGSMMARLDRAFFDGDKLDPNASDVLQHILDVTSESLNAVVGDGYPRTPGPHAVVNQHEFGYGRQGTDLAGASLNALA